MADKETVTLKLPSGESVDFVVPGGMSDDAIKSLAFSKRPDLFQKAAQPPPFLDAANQSKQQFMAKSPLAPTERAMQQTMGGPPMFVDVPKGQKQSFEQAGQRGYQTGGKAGVAALAVPSAVAAPLATALGIGGSLVGGYATKKGAEFLGASPETAENAGTVGGVVGGMAGAGIPSAASAMKEVIKRAALTPSGELTAGFNALVHPSEMGEMLFRKLIGAPKELEGSSVPITDSPYYKQWIEAKKTQALLTRQADAATKAAKAAEDAARKAVSIKESPYYNQNVEKEAAAKAAPKFEADPANPQGKIVQPSSAPPPVQRTYESIKGKDLLAMVMKGDRAAITEWQRRGLKLPGGVGFMVE